MDAAVPVCDMGAPEGVSLQSPCGFMQVLLQISFSQRKAFFFFFFWQILTQSLHIKLYQAFRPNT